MTCSTVTVMLTVLERRRITVRIMWCLWWTAALSMEEAAGVSLALHVHRVQAVSDRLILSYRRCLLQLCWKELRLYFSTIWILSVLRYFFGEIKNDDPANLRHTNIVFKGRHGMLPMICLFVLEGTGCLLACWLWNIIISLFYWILGKTWACCVCLPCNALIFVTFQQMLLPKRQR